MPNEMRKNMRNANFNGIPPIQGKPVPEALDILYRHCYETAQLIDAMNKEIEELKYEVEQLKFRAR